LAIAMRRLSAALPCALIFTFLLEVDESEAFVVRSGGGRSSPHVIATRRRVSATSSDDAGASSSSVDPEEAMRTAFARLSILTPGDVQLFGDEEGEGGDTDGPDGLPRRPVERGGNIWYDRLDVKWEQPALGEAEEEDMRETDDEIGENKNDEREDNDDMHDLDETEYDSGAPQLWLPGQAAKRLTMTAKQNNDETTYEISQAIKDYEETYSTLQREAAMGSKSSPIIDAYVRDGDASKANVGMSQRNDNMEKRDDASILIPEPNPQADPDAVSLSGVPYQQVLSGLISLFPPKDLSLRNAASRKDGYWEYISKGEEPPKQFTYGEFDFYFFSELLDKARYYYNGDTKGTTTVNSWDGMTFTDIGAGAGRLVFAAAALHPGFRLCRGLEILPSIHQVAEANLEKCRVLKRDIPSLSSDNNVSDVVDGPTKLWQIPKQADEDWLQSFSGSLFDDNGEEDEEEEEDEWFNPDDWASNYDSSDDNTDDGDDDEDWENPDQFLQQFRDVDGPRNEEGLEYIAEAETTNICSDDEFFLSCPPISEDGSIVLEGEDSQQPQLLPLAPIDFSCGSFENAYEYFGDSDVIFVFSSCMRQDLMSSLSMAIGRQCKPGSIIITTEFSLPLEGYIGPYQCSIDDMASSFASQDDDLPTGSYKLELLESVDGWVWLTGGESTAYIHRVVESLWEEGIGKRERPAPTAHQTARAVVEAIRCESLSNTEDFLREVRNNILFNGLPDEWRIEQKDDGENEEYSASRSESEVLLL